MVKMFLKMAVLAASYALCAHCAWTAEVEDLLWEQGLQVINGATFIPPNIVRIVPKMCPGWQDIRGVFFAANSQLKTIAEGSFADCKELVTIDFADSTPTLIGAKAFYNCTNLQNLVIPPSVRWIGEDAFSLCSSLGTLDIPNSVQVIGSCAFVRCNLREINFEEGCQLKTIRQHTFENNAIESITLPKSIESIEDYAFFGCRNLMNVRFSGKKVTTIGDYAFCNCKKLEQIEIPESVTTIGTHAFFECWKLNKIQIPKSVTRLGKYLFAGTIPYTYYNLASIKFESKTLEFEVDGVAVKLNTDDKKIAFLEDIISAVRDGCVATFSDETQFVYIGAKWHRHNIVESPEMSTAPEVAAPVQVARNIFGTKNVSIPGDVIHITSGIYSKMLDIETVSFAGCKQLTTIGEGAFAGCRNLRSVDFADSAPTLIDAYAFSECGDLQNFVIPPSVVNFGQSIFHNSRLQYAKFESVALAAELNSHEQKIAFLNRTMGKVPGDCIADFADGFRYTYGWTPSGLQWQPPIGRGVKK
jgi:hypothetical protein